MAVVGLEAERVRLGVRERAVEILGGRLRDVDRQRDAALEGDVDADAVASATAHQLREHAARRVRMDERDLEAEGAAARLLVDQLGAVGGQPLELRRRRRRPRTRRGACPGPREARNFPTGVSGPSDPSSSTRPLPTRIDTASTPWSATVSRCSSSAPKRRW